MATMDIVDTDGNFLGEVGVYRGKGHRIGRLYRVAYKSYKHLYFPFTPRQLRVNPRRDYELVIDADGAIYGYSTAYLHHVND